MNVYTGSFVRNGLKYRVIIAVEKKSEIREILRFNCYPLVPKYVVKKQWQSTKSPHDYRLALSKPKTPFARINDYDRWRELVIDSSGVYFI